MFGRRFVEGGFLSLMRRIEFIIGQVDEVGRDLLGSVSVVGVG